MGWRTGGSVEELSKASYPGARARRYRMSECALWGAGVRRESGKRDLRWWSSSRRASLRAESVREQGLCKREASTGFCRPSSDSLRWSVRSDKDDGRCLMDIISFHPPFHPLISSPFSSPISLWMSLHQFFSPTHLHSLFCCFTVCLCVGVASWVTHRHARSSRRLLAL